MNIIPPLAFLLFLAIAILMGVGARRMAPKGPSEPEAETSYAGGEDIPGEKRHPGYRAFFLVALFFTILHVLALILGLLPAGSAWIGLIYAGVLAFSLLALTLR